MVIFEGRRAVSFPETGGHQFEVLFVCTGNICRSPIAEQLFRKETARFSGLVTVSSAGTSARPGQEMTEQAAVVSRLYGGDPVGHGASSLTSRRIQQANLVLALSREHRSEIVSMVPRASRKTFTLREIDRLIRVLHDVEPRSALEGRGLTLQDLDSFVRDVASMRGFSQTMPLPADDDVIDPYRQSQATYDEAGVLINNAVQALSEALLSAAGSSSRVLRDDSPGLPHVTRALPFRTKNDNHD
jgi:protein-tyrosine phosphatase